MRTFQHFDDLTLLATGATCRVFRATQVSTGRSVALKVLKTPLQEEGRALGSVQSRCVVQVYEAGNWRNRGYIAMELLDGETLAQRLARQQFIPTPVALDIARDVLRALAVVHRAGLVHRDVKPSNVFLCANGTRKLIDFGLAHAAGDRRGTERYASPELLRGEQTTARADLYAVGLLLYQMLAGHRAFEKRRTADAELWARMVDTPEPFNRPDLGSNLKRFVLRMLAPDPCDRPENAERALRELDRLVAGGGGTRARDRAAPRVPPTRRPGVGGTTRRATDRRALPKGRWQWWGWLGVLANPLLLLSAS